MGKVAQNEPFHPLKALVVFQVQFFQQKFIFHEPVYEVTKTLIFDEIHLQIE